MKSASTTLGLVLVAIGAVWFLQGIGVLPGSFMSGQTKWAVIGAVTAAVGVGVTLLARR